ncbi:PREDICTED: uncharacterized protein LOC109589407 [Amphimedon queenslandica]|nr:PREDICTED: uncharacterized protein LOC109589407 [Amphimedon queenslandica]|eukprot:XP_019861062.1 PREDICTED: uncharacterized protein LOC109589407 [Amphimedon queenslandica]
MRVFPGGTTEGLIGGLDPNLNYLFSISISYNVNGIIYEGERTQPIPPVTYSTETTIMTTPLTTVSTTVLVNNGGNIGVIVGPIVALTVLLVLAIIIIIILVLVMHIKRTNINQKRKSDNDIVMECSPAYATAEFKTNTADDILMKDSPAYSTVQQTQLTVEPVYDTTNNEYETPLPPPAEYEIPTV